jgi:hypothetical protein
VRLAELLREPLGLATCALTLSDCPEILLPAFHPEYAPQVAPALLLLVLRVPIVRHLNGPICAAEDSGARGPLVFRIRLLDLLDKK